MSSIPSIDYNAYLNAFNEMWPVLVVLVAAAVFILSLYCPIHRIPLFYSVPLVLSTWIPLSIVVLVPADIAGGLGLSEHARLVLWRVVYWLSFVLTWAVLPSLQYYCESGYHEPLTKIKDALRSNVKRQVAMAAAGIVGLLYMGISTGLRPSSLKALAVALSHSYALVLCIWLLGHGLVSVPRDLWNSLPAPALRRIYGSAPSTLENYTESLGSYHEAAGRIIALIPVKTPTYSAWIDELVDDVRASTLGYPTNSRHQISQLDDLVLAQLSQRVARERARAFRYRADWRRLLEDAAFYQDLGEDTKGEFRFYRTRLPFAYFFSVRPWLVRIGAAVLASLSVVIALSEVFMGTRLSLIDLAIKGSSDTARIFLTMGLLGYMCFVTGQALCSVRVFNLYGLVHLHTDISSLMFYATYACRLAVPLSFNFLSMSGSQASVFQEFLGKFINLTPLGKYFNEALPRLIVVFMALTWFEFYRAVHDYFGFVSDDVESAGDGKQLVDRALTDARYEWGLEAIRGA